jgi:uncharacterized protein
VEKAEPPADVWVDDRVTVRPSRIEGSGLFASEDIPEGTVVIRLGGRLVTTDELERLIARENAKARYVDTITAYDEQHLVLPPATIVHFGNHSCDPTLWYVGAYELATRRDVSAGEELTVDYGTASGARDFVMECRCHSAECREKVTSDDWQRPELQERYRGHWVPTLQDRIDRARGV